MNKSYILIVGLLYAIISCPVLRGAAEVRTPSNVNKQEIQQHVQQILLNNPIEEQHLEKAFELIEQLKVKHRSTETYLLKDLFRKIMSMPSLDKEAQQIAENIINRIQEKFDYSVDPDHISSYEKMLNTFTSRLTKKINMQHNSVSNQTLSEYLVKGKEFDPVQSAPSGPSTLAPVPSTSKQKNTDSVKRTPAKLVPEQNEQQPDQVDKGKEFDPILSTPTETTTIAPIPSTSARKRSNSITYTIPQFNDKIAVEHKNAEIVIFADNKTPSRNFLNYRTSAKS